MKCSRKGERDKMREKLEDTFSWLNSEGDDADTAQYLDKRTSLE
jgi:hypoxia up-regulated 1